MKKKSLDKLYENLNQNLTSRHWGIRAKGTSPGGCPKFYIMDYRGLALATGMIRYAYHVSDEESRIFYRGQIKDWELKSSLYRYCHNEKDCNKNTKWIESVLDAIEPVFDPKGTDDEREGLAQHYGLPTRFLDVVDNAQTALWFAYDKIREDDRYDQAVGYIHVVAVPKEYTILDLRNKPSEWLRPHVQQGFIIKNTTPDKELGSYSKYLVATFIIARENLRLWSNYDNFPRSYFYPSDSVDKGASYWKKARRNIKGAGLSLTPPVWQEANPQNLAEDFIKTMLDENPSFREMMKQYLE